MAIVDLCLSAVNQLSLPKQFYVTKTEKFEFFVCESKGAKYFILITNGHFLIKN